MAKTLSRFYTLAKDKDKDKATLFVRVQDPVRRIDVHFTSPPCGCAGVENGGVEEDAPHVIVRNIPNCMICSAELRLC